ncbi:imelysin family protein [Flavobacterium sp. RNTU_13]|uniref:imelysin family protein n=1 Tax=Flavobacterium sp. RNTU_13 TaxID=3375145 RepID=UPI003985C861
MKKIVALFTLIIIAAGCSSSDGNNTSNTANYDKNAVLTNWADNIIIPAYTAYDAALGSLQTAVSAFTETPTEANLITVQTAWLDAYKKYQHVAMFDTGMASDLNLMLSANTFPTDVTGIETNISSGTYNLELQSQFSRQGFPALDYLLYGMGSTNEETVAVYAGAAGNSYKQYITAVVNRLKTISAAVLADWNGAYRNTFVNNTNSVTGSLNHSTNNFVKNLEKDVRYPKVGIPAGLFSNGVLFPEKVEAYFRGNVSKILLNEAITASKKFFNGTYYNSNGTGASLKGYLDAVGAKSEGQNLSDIINAQYETILTKNGALNDSFTTQVTTDNSKMIAAYNAMQTQVVYLKVNMFSALSLTIDYVDGDGD